MVQAVSMKTNYQESVCASAIVNNPAESLAVLPARAADTLARSIQHLVQPSDRNLGHLEVQVAYDVQELLRQVVERGAQAKADATPLTCPVCCQPLTRCSSGHARDHLRAMAHLLHGEGTPQARAWVQPLLKSLRTGGVARVVRRLEQLLEAPWACAPARQAEVEREVRCFQKHRDHLHYRAMEEAGAPLGSGAAESLGKQLQQRLRGCGQAWVRPGLTHLLRLCVLVRNRDDPLLWN
jgi:hypothetical protein